MKTLTRVAKHLPIEPDMWAGRRRYNITKAQVKREEKLREEAERKKLVKTIREEMLQQTGRYPVLMASPQTTQELPALPPATAVQPAGAGTSAVQMPLLPPHQPIAAAGQTQDLSLEGHPYKPKVGLTPGELNKNRSTDAGGPTPVVAGTPRSQTQTPVQVSVATLKQQTVSSTSPSKTPTPTPTPTPIPTPTPTPTSPVIPTINQPQVQPRPPGEKVDAKKGGGSV